MEYGTIAAVHIAPQLQKDDIYHSLGIIGQHDMQLSVDSMCLSHDETHLISYGGDQTVRFWNIEFLERLQVRDESGAMMNRRHLQSSRFLCKRRFYYNLDKWDQERRDKHNEKKKLEESE